MVDNLLAQHGRTAVYVKIQLLAFSITVSIHLVDVSLSDNKDQLGVLLHHRAILEDTLHLHRHLLTPGGAWTTGVAGFQHLFPQ